MRDAFINGVLLGAMAGLILGLIVFNSIGPERPRKCPVCQDGVWGGCAVVFNCADGGKP